MAILTRILQSGIEGGKEKGDKNVMKPAVGLNVIQPFLVLSQRPVILTLFLDKLHLNG